MKTGGQFLLCVAFGCDVAVSMNGAVLRTGSVEVQQGISGGGGSYAPKISANGRYVVFVSHANNLATNSGRGAFLNVFRHDLLSGETILVSADQSGAGNGGDDSNYPDISADGRYISFVSAATNL